MNRDARVRSILVAVLAMLPALAAADALDGPKRAPVLILLKNTEPFANPGQSYSNTLQVTLMEAGSLGTFAFSDNGWTPVSLEQPPGGVLPAGTQFDLDFEVIPVNPSLPLRLSTTYEAQNTTRNVAYTYDLSWRGWQRMNTARGLLFSEAPGPDEGPVGQMREADEIEGSGTRRTIITYGTLVFWRDRSDVDPTPVQVGAYGVTVKVWDDDTIGRTFMGETVTDADGRYSVTTDWTASGDPDIYVEFSAENDHAEVRPGPTLTRVYRWQTLTKRNWAGNHCDFHTGWSEDDDDAGALKVLTNIRRARAWMNARSVAPTEDVVVFYPHGDWPSYLNGNIDLPTVAWADSEATIIHEFGHHWMHNYGLDTDPPEYCNPGDFHDPDPAHGDCGHGAWCEENPDIAWDEGVPNWFADVITRSYSTDYGRPALQDRRINQLEGCDEDNWVRGDPFITEEFPHALLWDIMDDDANDYTPNTPQWSDALNSPIVNEDNILFVLTLHRPQTVGQFIDDFLLSGGAAQSDFWETCMNLGYDGIDTTPPSVVAGLGSSSHEIAQDSADATIDFIWGPASDDFSGVDAYAIAIASTPNPIPGYEIALLRDPMDAVVAYTSAPLAAGLYWISVRARDQAGNWSPDYESAGPYWIRDPLPADIAYGQNYSAGIAGPLVLRDDDTALLGLIQWSETLPGDTPGVYFNIVTTNLGEEPAEGPFRDTLYIDGQVMSPWTGITILSVPALSNVVRINEGPITVPAGRHVVSVHYDGGEVVPEPSELNNTCAVQVVFIPPVITPGVVYTLPAPPAGDGGFADFVGGPPSFPDNKAGLRFAVGSAYDAVVIWANDNEEDYDCALYEPATSVTIGFGPTSAAAAHSSRRKGKVDAVITNAHTALPHSTWDVGVINESDGDTTFVCAQVRSSPIVLGALQTISMSADERLAMRGFVLSGANLGWKEIVLSTAPSAGQLHVGWSGPGVQYSSLADLAQHTTTDEEGNARLEVEVLSAGYNLIAVWRDPCDDPAASKLDAISFDLSVQTSRPDLVFLEEPPNWYSPIVPRPDMAGTPETVYGPTYLLGDTPDTYLNINAYNQGKADALAVEGEVEVDGAPLLTATLGNCPSESNVTVNQTTPVQIPAGRHCLSVDLDPANTIAEASEENNRFAEQYVWRPSVLPAAALVQRTVPAGPVSGWEAVSTLRGPLRFNCDGVALPSMPGTWYGVAILPEDSSDVDLRLHEAMSDAKLGFGNPLAFSGWGAGESDFVLVNTAVTAARPFHVGLIGSAGSGSFDIDAARSTFLGTDPIGLFGPFSVDANELLDLHHVVLSAGALSIALEDDGADDLGISIHRGDVPFGSKSQPLEDGISFVATAGNREVIIVDIPADGDYCLAVWRRQASTGETIVAAAYTIEFSTLTHTPPGESRLARTSLVGVFPTPFNPRLTVEFELAREEHVKLEVYNLRGQKVRTLASGRLPAGSHIGVWDGEDESGQRVPTGVYLVQLSGEQSTDRRKVTLMK